MFFFFNDTATTEIYTLSLHDALPIFLKDEQGGIVRLPNGAEARYFLAPDSILSVDNGAQVSAGDVLARLPRESSDRKSTRLNSSHANISYAVFCLKKKI